MSDIIKELHAAGYTDAQIEREVKYLERVSLENERIGRDKAWNYGFVGPNDSFDADGYLTSSRF